jgi:hypothetical protein
VTNAARSYQCPRHYRRWRHLFWVIDRFVRDARLSNLLKILVALLCAAAILQRVLPALGIGWL